MMLKFTKIDMQIMYQKFKKLYKNSYILSMLPITASELAKKVVKLNKNSVKTTTSDLKHL